VVCKNVLILKLHFRNARQFIWKYFRDHSYHYITMFEILESEFEELLDYSIHHLPSSLSVYSWLDLRVKYGPLGLPFSPSHCVVDSWPHPNIILCISRLKLPGNKEYSFVCMWSNVAVEIGAEFLLEALKILKIENCTFPGLDRNVADALSLKLGDKISHYKADQFWIDPVIHDKLSKLTSPLYFYFCV